MCKKFFCEHGWSIICGPTRRADGQTAAAAAMTSLHREGKEAKIIRWVNEKPEIVGDLEAIARFKELYLAELAITSPGVALESMGIGAFAAH